MLTRNHRMFSNDALRAKTGRDWSEWLMLVQAWDREENRLFTVRDYLVNEYHLEPAWAEIVALQYRLETLWRGTAVVQ
jgi:hypothetical protein